MLALTGAGDITDLMTAEQGAVLVWGSLAVAVVVVLVRWFTLGDERKLSDSLGAVNWDFTQSWASTLTALGALLGTILSDVLPPETTALSVQALGGLNLLFGLLVVLAPVVFSAFARAESGGASDEPEYTGTVWSFLVACGLTLWAVLGELATIFVLLQASAVGTLSPSLRWLFAGLTAVGVVLLVIYSWRRIGTTIEYRQSALTARPRRWSLL